MTSPARQDRTRMEEDVQERHSKIEAANAEARAKIAEREEEIARGELREARCNMRCDRAADAKASAATVCARIRSRA